jgi:hypothetical protein
MARVLEESLESDERLERLRERSRRRADRFTWARVARKTVEGYEAALGAGNGAARRRVRATRARTAWVTPWPPERSGSRHTISGSCPPWPSSATSTSSSPGASTSTSP